MSALLMLISAPIEFVSVIVNYQKIICKLFDSLDHLHSFD